MRSFEIDIEKLSHITTEKCAAWNLHAPKRPARALYGIQRKGAEYAIRINVESADGGFRLGWIEVRDGSGNKPEEIHFAHAYEGEQVNPLAESPTEEEDGFRIPQMGDPLFGLFVVSLLAIASGIAVLVAAVALKRRRRDGSHSDKAS